MNKYLRFLLPIITVIGISFQSLQAQYKYEWEMGSDALGLTQLHSPQQITIDGAGNMYVIDGNNYRILKYNSAGQFLLKFGSLGTADGQFSSPSDIAADAEGNVYVTDASKHLVQKFSANGQFLSKIGSGGTADGQFQSPVGIATDVQGNIYVADTVKKCIQKFNTNGQFLLKFGSKGTANGQFTTIKDMAMDTQGNIYIPDHSNNRVQKFTTNGQFLSTILINDIISTDNSIAVDGEGNLYMPVTNDQDEMPSIRKYSSSGQYLFEYCKYGLEEGQIEALGGIAVDAQGNVYISDFFSNTVYKRSSDGQIIWQIDPLANGQFTYPTKIAVSEQGNVYVLDARNNRVQILSPTGQFLFKFGSKGIGDNQIWFPTDVDVDEEGSIYVLDRGYVKKFNAQGEFVRKFGSDEYGGEGYFFDADAVTVDKNGDMYVFCGINSLQMGLLKFSPTGQFLMKLNLNEIQEGQPLVLNDIALDEQGNIYLSAEEPMIEKSCVVKLSSDLQLLSKFAREGNENYQLNFPDAIHVDKSGNIYLADVKNIFEDFRIRKFSPEGQLLSTTVSPGNFSGIAIDAEENLYITESEKHRVLKYSYATDVKSYNYIQGTIYEDTNQDCVPDATEHRVAGAAVIAQPGPYYGLTDSLGNYSIRVGTGSYIVSQIPPADSAIKQTCPPDNEPYRVTFKDYGDTIQGNNFNRKLVAPYNYIQGTIYEDTNQNCVPDSSERRVAGAAVIAQPGSYYGLTDSLGNYSIQVGKGSYIVSQILPVDSFIKQTCPPDNEPYGVTFKDYSDTIRGNDFSRELTFLTLLSTSVSSDRRRRCATSNTTISYQNSGNAIANDVRVHLQLPEHVVLVSANMPFAVDQNKNYVFSIGDLSPQARGKISIVDSVVCNNPNIRGLTQCTKVWITPANNKTPSPDWDKSDITLKARCTDNGFVKLSIHNTGTGHMADSSSFRIYLDAQQVFQHRYKLNAGDSLSLQVPANGQTLRLEADQRPYHPTKTQTNISIEACGVTSAGKVSTGFVAQLPQDDEELEVAIECLPIIDSYDPNDKLVLPQGVTENHYTPTNTALDYTIRFQNTGTDYAYKVVVVDTLSEHLDMSTFQIGTASHAYKLNITGKGRPILTWTFDNINLPDSTRDQLGSNGFIKFSIKPLATIAEKTVIENFADIFFDFNEPVRTNTVFNSIYDVPAPVVNNEKVIICQTNTVAFAGNNRSFCEQHMLNLQASAPAAGKGKWKILKGAATIQDLTNPASSVTNLAYGENIFEWKVPTNSCSTDSTSSTVTIYRKPAPGTPVITQIGTDSLFCSISATSYEWYRDGIKIVGKNQQIKVSDSGKYTVKVSMDECSSPLSEAFTYQKTPTGLEEYGAQIKVYPNPATSSVFIELPADWQATLTLSDAMGRAVKESMLTRGESKVELLLTGIKAGIYILHITTKDGTIVKKLIIR
ncbi:6-bladed beta-propeller [Rhodocytophaga rosea]|uniref:6-bladed beta-propeller n=1 Tax=Rhodocytophaga rosea TaxID=2704465 RepID=A0A6C0GFF8_9BACT|nr:6-bladed beta-propeller [Rhodocytophaga rosea]QHT66761.1 6-bladed beta-propeller [Rhodocytophaga rosea]